MMSIAGDSSVSPTHGLAHSPHTPHGRDAKFCVSTPCGVTEMACILHVEGNARVPHLSCILVITFLITSRTGISPSSISTSGTIPDE